MMAFVVGSIRASLDGLLPVTQTDVEVAAIAQGLTTPSIVAASRPPSSDGAGADACGVAAGLVVDGATELGTGWDDGGGAVPDPGSVAPVAAHAATTTTRQARAKMDGRRARMTGGGISAILCR